MPYRATATLPGPTALAVELSDAGLILSVTPPAPVPLVDLRAVLDHMVTLLPDLIRDGWRALELTRGPPITAVLELDSLPPVRLELASGPTVTALDPLPLLDHREISRLLDHLGGMYDLMVARSWSALRVEELD